MQQIDRPELLIVFELAPTIAFASAEPPQYLFRWRACATGGLSVEPGGLELMLLHRVGQVPRFLQVAVEAESAESVVLTRYRPDGNGFEPKTLSVW